MSGVQRHIISEDDDGQRIDRWFFKNFPDVPKSHVFRIFRKGEVRLDSKRVKPDTRLKAGQEMRIPPLATKASPGPKKLPVSDKEKAYYRSLVLYEDNDVIVLNKPAGLAVQGGSGITKHLDAFLHIFDDKNGVTPRLVHRLDRQTSGVLLLAKSAASARELGKAFKSRDVKKLYWAITSPVPDSPQGEVNAPLSKGHGADKELVQIDKKDGKSARSLYHVMDKASSDFAHVCFWPLTGRTHQIRVHSVLLGAPILGDDRYGGRTDFDDMFGVEDDVSQRLYLHARRIVCDSPSGNGTIDITAPLPDQDKKLWQLLGFDPENDADPFDNNHL